ncbi:methylenetetrahydrofolate reductase [NAD(P)H] [Elusimicrobiota bacterium]
MKIIDIYKEKDIVFSCEVFPPKPEYNINMVYNTISGLKDINPDFVSVTYGAGGTSKGRTEEIASQIKNKFTLESLMHLTCVNSKYKEIEDILIKIKDEGIENILALRGDIPQGKDKDEIIKDFKYALDLLKFIKEHGDFCIGVAGYPEVHPEAVDAEEDTKYLKDKIVLGGDFIITQLFFKNDLFYRFRDRVQSAGIDVPMSAGIMPAFKANIAKRIVTLCGASIPGDLQQLIDKYGHKPEDMEKAGVDYACSQINDLLENNVNGIHLYTMNNAGLAENISKNTGLR